MTEASKKRGFITRYSAVELLLLSGFLLLFLTLAFLQFSWPLDSDHGAYYWMADVLLSGGQPYIDFWDIKGPLFGYIYVAIRAVFGDATWGLRLVDCYLVIQGMLCIWYVMKRHTDGFSALICSLIVGIMFFDDYQMSAHSEGWMTILTLNMLALVCWDKGRMLFRTLIALGFCASLIILIKYPFAILMLVPAVYQYVNYKTAWKKWLVFQIKFGVVALGFSALFCVAVLSPESLKAMIDILFVYSLESHRGMLTDVFFMENFFDFLEPFAEYIFRYHRIIPAILFVVLCISWKKYRAISAPVIAWQALILLLIYVQLRPWGYYVLPLFFPLVIGASYMLYVLSKKRQNMSYAIYGMVLVLCVHFHYHKNIKDGIQYVAGSMSQEEYYNSLPYFIYPAPAYGAIHSIGQYMKEHTDPTEKVMVFAYYPLLYFHSERQAASRFGYDMPLAVSTGERKERYFHDLRMDLVASQPRYLVHITSLLSHFVTDAEEVELIWYYPFIGDPFVRKFIDDNYYFDIEFGIFYLFRRHDEELCYPQPHYMNYTAYRMGQSVMDIFPAPLLAGNREELDE